VRADAPLAIVRALDGCELTSLDSAERGLSCAVITEDGRFLKLSGSAALLVLGLQRGESLDELGRQCGASVTDVATTCDALATKIMAVRAAPRREALPGFVITREWLSSATVRAIAAPAAALCGPRSMIAIGALAVAILAFVLGGAPVPKLTLGSFWLAYLANLPILVVHELGHAATCARYGARVGPIGATIYMIYPALYCDVTDAWRLRRWQRVAVDLGGLYFQAIVTAVVALGWYVTGADVLYATAMMSVGISITNLIPFFALDGYWCLSDALGVVNLNHQRRVVVAGIWARIRGRVAPPFPWSAPLTAFVVVYSAAAITFAGYVLWRLVPIAGRHLAGLPQIIVQLVTAGDLPIALAALGRLATSMLVLVGAALFTRHIVRRSTTVIVRRIRREQPRS
jgi:putative peptide zinc metalloprotease protein